MTSSHRLLLPSLESARTLTVAVGSCNPCKIDAVKSAFEQILLATDPRGTVKLVVKGYAARSGVPDQPVGDTETKTGAANRAREAAELSGGCDFSVGLEGGIVDECNGEDTPMWCMAYMAVFCPSESTSIKQWGFSRTASFPLPPLMAKLVRGGVELGDADDMVTGRVNSKQGGGTVGALTKDIVTRKLYYEHAIVLAMCKFIQYDVFFQAEVAQGRDGTL